MAAFGVRPCLLVSLLVLVACKQTEAENVTHEDLRDGMLSLVHLFRISHNKLDRHEAREKALGDQLKKMLLSLEKKHKALEPLDGLIRRLDNRLSNVETIFFQKEEKEKATQQKTNEMLESIQKSLQALTATVTNSSKRSPPEESNLTTEDDSINRRLDETNAKLDAVQQEIRNLKNNFHIMEDLREACLAVVPNVNPFERHISEAEKLLNKYELKLNEFNETSKVPTDFVPLNEVILADESWHNKMSEVIERQEGEIKKIQQLLSNAESTWKELPRRDDLSRATSDTLQALHALEAIVSSNETNSVSEITAKLHELRDQFTATNQDIQQSLTQGNTMSEQAYTDVLKSYNTLSKELSTLTAIQADDVASIKKRIDYGDNRVLLEIAEMIKIQGKLLNYTLQNSFQKIESEILSNQTMFIGNLTSKIESDMAQVWRQMGNMYQQLSYTKSSIDKLSEQTAQYFNGTAKRVENINSQVGGMTKHVNELSDNLNYAMGRMRLGAQEFSQLRAGLTDALRDARVALPPVLRRQENSTDPDVTEK